MSETLKKINIYIRPELKIIAKKAAASEGLSLSAWFRKRAHDELTRQVQPQPHDMRDTVSTKSVTPSN
jgi:predicted HicB family RNase H-like nuclease